MSLARTTKLEAVNVMLGVIGESPVNTLGGSSRPVSVVTAENVLDEVNKAVQAIGWHFNTEHKYPFTKDADGKITLADNVLKVDAAADKHTDLDLVQRGSQLYDRKEHTDVFTEDLELTVTFLLDFTEIPEQFRNYVTLKAARIFASRFMGSQEITGFTLRDEIEAKAAAVDADSESADRTIFGNYDVYRVIDR
tara:strand:- start:2038 stop:2619 length:582 start_codon:yes stop_codon:yes gene_type:complete